MRRGDLDVVVVSLFVFFLIFTRLRLCCSYIALPCVSRCRTVSRDKRARIVSASGKRMRQRSAASRPAQSPPSFTRGPSPRRVVIDHHPLNFFRPLVRALFISPPLTFSPLSLASLLACHACLLSPSSFPPPLSPTTATTPLVAPAQSPSPSRFRMDSSVD